MGPHAFGRRIWGAFAFAAILLVHSAEPFLAGSGTHAGGTEGQRQQEHELHKQAKGVLEARLARTLEGCAAQPQSFKFFMYDWGVARRCKLRTDAGVRSVAAKAEPQWLQDLFFYFQMLKHPWRTRDPSEAFLFFVPLLPSLTMRGLCRPRTYQRIISQLTASPWYKRHNGSDHMLLFMDWKVKSALTREPEASIFRNFIMGRRRNYLTYPTHCTFTVPHTSTTARMTAPCRPDSATGHLVCGREDAPERTFDEYLRRRNHTLFFMGQADDREAYRLRREVVKHLGPVRPEGWPENWIVGTQKKPKEGRRDCTLGSWEGCHYSGHSAGLFTQGLSSSRIQIMTRGEDPSSSRMFDGLDAGTPQLLLSDPYMEDIAPFHCRVPWRKIVHQIPEAEFFPDPERAVSNALETLSRNGNEGWRSLWEAQRKYRDELLWHTPGSRVGHNVLEEVWRQCTGGSRKHIWDSYVSRIREKEQL